MTVEANVRSSATTSCVPCTSRHCTVEPSGTVSVGGLKYCSTASTAVTVVPWAGATSVGGAAWVARTVGTGGAAGAGAQDTTVTRASTSAARPPYNVRGTDRQSRTGRSHTMAEGKAQLEIQYCVS